MTSKARKPTCLARRRPRRDIDSLDLRPPRRQPRYPMMNQLSSPQAAQFRALAGVYRADLLDPAAWEALLILLEICNILDLLPSVKDKIFGQGMVERLETWSGEIPHRRRPGQVQRAWVWLPNEPEPHVYPIGEEGTIELHGAAGG